MTLAYDITSTIQWVITTFLSLIAQLLGILKNIEFFGTNLLSVSITITILSILVPILINIAKSNRGGKSD